MAKIVYYDMHYKGQQGALYVKKRKRMLCSVWNIDVHSLVLKNTKRHDISKQEIF